MNWNVRFLGKLEPKWGLEYPFLRAYKRITHLFELGEKEKRNILRSVWNTASSCWVQCPSSILLDTRSIYGCEVTYSPPCFVLFKHSNRGGGKTQLIKTENMGQTSYLTMPSLSFSSPWQSHLSNDAHPCILCCCCCIALPKWLSGLPLPSGGNEITPNNLYTLLCICN